MENENMENAEKLQEATPASEPDNAGVSEELKDPLQKKPERTEKEKAMFTLRKTADRVRQLGADPEEVLGLKKEPVDEDMSDDTFLTVGAFKDIQKKEARKTALEMAQQIEDEYERAEVIRALSRVVPSGKAIDDYNFAVSAAGAKRSYMIAEDIQRRIAPAKTASGGSTSAKKEEQFEPTEEEKVFMSPPYNLTKEDVLKARGK
jgi:hypothetical protein